MAPSFKALARLFLAPLAVTEVLANGGPIVISLQQATHSVGLGRRDVGLYSFPNKLYSASGTVRGQKFQFGIDTGSADVVVPDPACPTDQCGDGPRYDQGGQSLGLSTSYLFGGGQVQGDLFIDSLSIGGYTATNQTLLSAQSNTITNGTNITAVLGLGFPAASKSNSTPFFQNLVNEGVVKTPEFSIYLALAADGRSNQGEMTLGGRNEKLFDGPVTSVPVSSDKGYWMVTIDDVQIGGRSVGSEAGGINGILDTGGPALVGPPAAIAAMFAAIPGALELQLPPQASQGGLYAIPCNTSQQDMPSLVMSGRPFDIAAIDMIGIPATGVGQPGYCIANAIGFDLGSLQIVGGIWQLGDVFLRNWYTIHNLNGTDGKPSVEFARAKRVATQPIEQSTDFLKLFASAPAKGPASAMSNLTSRMNGTGPAPPAFPVTTGVAASLWWSKTAAMAVGAAALLMLL